eukprot:COSAG06_NODE_1679_length_8738_cov_49.835050_9_plen_126_part_00
MLRSVTCPRTTTAWTRRIQRAQERWWRPAGSSLPRSLRGEHHYTVAADLLVVSQAKLADALAVSYQKRLAHAENEIRVYKRISRRYIRYREDLEDPHKTHADTLVKKASLHREGDEGNADANNSG